MSGQKTEHFPESCFCIWAVFSQMPRHTCPSSSLVRQHLFCRHIFSPQSLTEGWRREQGCSLETVSLLEDQAEVYAALQFGNVPIPPEGVVVNIVPLNSYNAELSPTLKKRIQRSQNSCPKVLLHKPNADIFDVIEFWNFPAFFHQEDTTIVLQSFASKMTKLRQKHCKCIISPLFPLLFFLW